ncbi:MAG: hypothetical protein AB7O96_09645 [Pseudobdellovibrionaceae bacterium]
MALIKYITLILLFSGFALAADDVDSSSPPPQPEPEPKFEGHTHRISNGFHLGTLAGVSIFYAQPVESQWTVGARLSTGRQLDDKRGGDLDAAQYYIEENVEEVSMAEVNASFYFRENGHGRWGPFIRGGLGYSQHKMKSEWKRYDRDPGFFIIGDEKRLLESEDFEESWSSPFFRLGGYYQFAWGFHSESSVGHILELGINGLYYANKKTVEYTKPDGKTSSFSSASPAFNGEISYTIAF